MNVLKKIMAVFDRLNTVLAILAAIIIVFLMLAVSLDVSLSKSLNQPIDWMMEVTALCLLWITFLATAWLLKREGHVRLDIVLTRLNPRPQAMLTVVTSIISAIVCLILAVYGTQATWEHIQRGTIETLAIAIPSSVYLGIIPFGSLLLFIQFVRRSYHHLEKWKASRRQE
ncbi:TRAP transporter small permease [Chloroflexota bacterium]